MAVLHSLPCRQIGLMLRGRADNAVVFKLTDTKAWLNSFSFSRGMIVAALFGLLAFIFAALLGLAVTLYFQKRGEAATAQQEISVSSQTLAVSRI